MQGGRERARERDRCMLLYGDVHTRSAVLCARRGFRYSGASAARKKPKHYRYWWPSCRTDRVDLSARRKEIFLRGAPGREAEIGRRRTAGDTPRRKFTIIFAGAGRVAKWNFHDMAYTSRDETFFPSANFTVVAIEGGIVTSVIGKPESLLINFFFYLTIAREIFKSRSSAS